MTVALSAEAGAEWQNCAQGYNKRRNPVSREHEETPMFEVLAGKHIRLRKAREDECASGGLVAQG